MNRNPGESSELWFDRAAAEYHAAWDALSTRRRRWSITGNTDIDPSLVDEQYDAAVDRLEAADCERGDAAIALDRERRTNDRADRMRDHRMTGDPAAEPPRRPVYDDFRDPHNTVDWQRFRQAAASWDAAQTPPGAVQDPFNNLPAGH